MYSNRRVYSCNAILATKIFCYRYSTINNSAKNIFKLNLVNFLAIYSELSARNFLQIGLDMTLYDTYGLLFSRHSVDSKIQLIENVTRVVV